MKSSNSAISRDRDRFERIFTHVGYRAVSISPMFYEQHLDELIPKAQKDTDNLTVFFLRFWDLGT